MQFDGMGELLEYQLYGHAKSESRGVGGFTWEKAKKINTWMRRIQTCKNRSSTILVTVADKIRESMKGDTTDERGHKSRMNDAVAWCYIYLKRADQAMSAVVHRCLFPPKMGKFIEQPTKKLNFFGFNLCSATRKITLTVSRFMKGVFFLKKFIIAMEQAYLGCEECA